MPEPAYRDADYEWLLLDAGEAAARARNAEDGNAIARARANRNALIHAARATGMSTRKIAAVADVSETLVRKVLGEGCYRHGPVSAQTDRRGDG